MALTAAQAEAQMQEVFGAVSTGGKRMQTPPPEEEDGRKPHRPNGKGGQGKGWMGKGRKSQASRGTYARSYETEEASMEEMMRLLCRVVVRQEDMLNILKQSTSWVIFAKTEAPSIIPGLVAASQKWKEEITKQNSPLGNVSLRTTLFWCLLNQLMETFKNLTADQLQKAKDAGWSQIRASVPEVVACQSDPRTGRDQSSAADLCPDEDCGRPEGPDHIGDRDGLSFQTALDTQHARGNGGAATGCQLPKARGESVLREIGDAHGPGGSAAGRITDSQGGLQEIRCRNEAGRAHAVRTLVLRNNANYCYVNSAVRTILWAVAADPELETLLTNIGRSLIKGLLSHKGRSILVAGHILFSTIFTGWRSPAQQHDCAEFLAHLIARIGPGVCDGKWEARRQQLDSEGQSQVVTVDEGTCGQAISLTLPDGDMHQAQLLLHNWHAQAHPHALQKVPNLLFLSFSRYGGSPGVDQKNSCSIAWGRRVHMPVFSGDNDLSSGVVEFEVIAAIMHHGVVVTAGHYTAQLVEAEGDVLCDDNAIPAYRVRSPDSEMHRSSEVYILVCRRSRGASPGGGENMSH